MGDRRRDFPNAWKRLVRTIPKRTLLLILGLASVGGLVACGPSAEKVEVERSEVEADLAAYLPLLARAYATGEVEPLRPHAAEKELARIAMRVEELADEGKVLRPEFHSVTVESVNSWSVSQAFATTVEVWDLRLYALGSEDRLLSEAVGEATRVKYQIRHDGERWRVLARQIEE